MTNTAIKLSSGSKLVYRVQKTASHYDVSGNSNTQTVSSVELIDASPSDISLIDAIFVDTSKTQTQEELALAAYGIAPKVTRTSKPVETCAPKGNEPKCQQSVDVHENCSMANDPKFVEATRQQMVAAVNDDSHRIMTTQAKLLLAICEKFHVNGFTTDDVIAAKFNIGIEQRTAVARLVGLGFLKVNKLKTEIKKKSHEFVLTNLAFVTIQTVLGLDKFAALAAAPSKFDE